MKRILTKLKILKRIALRQLLKKMMRKLRKWWSSWLKCLIMKKNVNLNTCKQ